MIQLGRNITALLAGVGSSLQKLDDFIPLTCFNGWVHDCGPDCNTVLHYLTTSLFNIIDGVQADVMAHYSSLVGLCILHQTHPEYCSSLSISNYSSSHRSVFRSFLQEVHLLDPPPRQVCPGSRGVAGWTRLAALTFKEAVSLDRYWAVDLSGMSSPSSTALLVSLVYPHALPLMRQLFGWQHQQQRRAPPSCVCMSFSPSSSKPAPFYSRAVSALQKLLPLPHAAITGVRIIVMSSSSSSSGDGLGNNVSTVSQVRSELQRMKLFNQSVSVSVGQAVIGHLRSHCLHFLLLEEGLLASPHSMMW